MTWSYIRYMQGLNKELRDATPSCSGFKFPGIRRRVVWRIATVTLKMKAGKPLLNVHNYLPIDTATHRRRFESLWTPLWELQFQLCPSFNYISVLLVSVRGLHTCFLCLCHADGHFNYQNNAITNLLHILTDFRMQVTKLALVGS